MRITLFFFATVLSAQDYANLDATLWSQSSVEHQAAARQVYLVARTALDRALATPYWTAALEQTGDFRDKPPAIILDLDETLLDNTPSMAKRLREGGVPFTQQNWGEWVAESKATLLPGGLEFLQYARMRGVTVIFITNRTCNPEDRADPTRRNLKELGLEFGKLVCRTNTGDKSPRRHEITLNYRVLLLFGDDFNDFVTAPTTIDERQRVFTLYAQFFGERWFILPNPMYGSWTSPFGDDLKKKLQGLK